MLFLIISLMPPNVKLSLSFLNITKYIKDPSFVVLISQT